MIIQTTRFGSIVIDEKETVHFPEGLLGFSDLNTFIFLEDPKDDIFAWLQSCEEPAIAFPVLEPEFFAPDYRVSLTRSDLMALESQEQDSFKNFCIVTIPDDPTLMTANLKAPIMINLRNRKGRQCVLQDNNLAIREPIFSKLQSQILSGQWTARQDTLLVPLEKVETVLSVSPSQDLLG
jgi:flagellar assembly factor FliW